jgi:hypothetical protein
VFLIERFRLLAEIARISNSVGHIYIDLPGFELPVVELFQ